MPRLIRGKKSVAKVKIIPILNTKSKEIVSIITNEDPFAFDGLESSPKRIASKKKKKKCKVKRVKINTPRKKRPATPTELGSPINEISSSRLDSSSNKSLSEQPCIMSQTSALDAFEKLLHLNSEEDTGMMEVDDTNQAEPMKIDDQTNEGDKNMDIEITAVKWSSENEVSPENEVSSENEVTKFENKGDPHKLLESASPTSPLGMENFDLAKEPIQTKSSPQTANKEIAHDQIKVEANGFKNGFKTKIENNNRIHSYMPTMTPSAIPNTAPTAHTYLPKRTPTPSHIFHQHLPLINTQINSQYVFSINKVSNKREVKLNSETVINTDSDMDLDDTEEESEPITKTVKTQIPIAGIIPMKTNIVDPRIRKQTSDPRKRKNIEILDPRKQKCRKRKLHDPRKRMTNDPRRINIDPRRKTPRAITVTFAPQVKMIDAKFETVNHERPISIEKNTVVVERTSPRKSKREKKHESRKMRKGKEIIEFTTRNSLLNTDDIYFHDEPLIMTPDPPPTNRVKPTNRFKINTTVTHLEPKDIHNDEVLDLQLQVLTLKNLVGKMQNEFATSMEVLKDLGKSWEKWYSTKKPQDLENLKELHRYLKELTN